jgi:hypothetical protein
MQNTGDPLGCDIYCTDDFPLRMRLCWGEENLQAACLRRLNTDEASLASIGDDPTYGFNLVGQLNKSFDANGDMAAVGAQVAAEMRKDERVQKARARVLSGEESLEVQIEGETAVGPFTLVTSVGEMTVQLLNQGSNSTTG